MKKLNYYTSSADHFKTNGGWRFVLMAIAIFLMFGTSVFAQGGKAAASLEQIRNGSASSPTDPAQWQNGNAGNQTAHYAESHSIGYRALLSNLPAGTVTLTLGYDIRHSGKNAIDFLTHYDRLQPHDQFGHTQEEVNPTLGTGFTEGAGFTTYEIPRPHSNVDDIPGSVWDAIAPAKRLMTLWGGTITDIQYVTPYASLTDAQSEQRIIVTFTANGGDAVLAWGGHIANRFDWGFDNGTPLSAGGISGSPYHMRLIGWNLSNLGNQDRSLSAQAVVPLAGCSIAGLDPVCGATTNTYTATSVAPGATFVWSITAGNGTIVAGSQTTSATISGGTQSTIDVTAGASGSFTLSVQISAPGFLSESCSKTVTINAIPAMPNVTYLAPACDEITFSVRVNSPLASATYTLVDKCGAAITGVNPIMTPSTAPTSITFAGIPAGSGYQVTVTKDGCTSAANTCGTCSTLQGALIESSSSATAIQPVRIDEEDNITAYPVPFSKTATLEFRMANTERYEINLYDMKGNLIKQLKSGKAKAGELQQIEVDGQKLPEGMYLVRVVTRDGAQTVKLLKKE